jgi:glycosyltransferase involved in cell wall biosynthesis
MKVAIISHAYVLSHHHKKIEELSKFKDLEIFLITPYEGTEGGGQKIKLEKTHDPYYQIIPLSTTFTGKWNLYKYKNLKKTLQKIQPDIIHLEEEYWTRVASQVVKIKKQLRSKPKLILFTWENIFHAWEKESHDLYEKIRFLSFQRAEKKVIPEIDIVIAGNLEAQKVILKKGFRKETTVISQFGFNPWKFRKTQREETRAKLNLKHFTLGYFGRVSKQKGVDLILEAMGKINKPLKLLVLGEGEYQKEFLNLAQKLNLEKSIILKKPLPPQKLPPFYSAIDLLVLPSITTPAWKEQFGRVIIEAQACQTPVIGSSSGAIPEVIGDPQAIFPENNVTGLTQLIEKITTHKDFLETLTNKGYQNALSRFTNTIIAQKTHACYQKLKQS